MPTMTILKTRHGKRKPFCTSVFLFVMTSLFCKLFVADRRMLLICNSTQALLFPVVMETFITGAVIG